MNLNSERLLPHLKCVSYTEGKIDFYTKKGDGVQLDGEQLTIADMVAVSRYKVLCDFSYKNYDVIKNRINHSVNFLHRHLDNGHVVYGVNTGFGGSADTRTQDTVALQKALIQMQNSGVIVRPHIEQLLYHNMDPTSMPHNWVRGAMLARCNSLIRGHSAVRLRAMEMIITFLRHDFIPVIPLRGSISASGDLSPLSYIAGALEGNPDICIQSGKENNYQVFPAPAALAHMKLEPIVLGPKEGLGLINGTAFSVAVGSLAVHEACQLSILSQLLTAMGVEALLGSADNYHPFIAQVRPHWSQVESAHLIHRLLKGSRLARDVGTTEHVQEMGLAQDRYALRTASQWIGPQLDDLSLAASQIRQELNSTTDNPLVDVQGGRLHHGGNFQAASVTSAMEKTRSAVQMLGRMIFSQCGEMINPALNNGLPANLAADNPSLSYTMKGVDARLSIAICNHITTVWPTTNTLDYQARCKTTVDSMLIIIHQAMLTLPEPSSKMQQSNKVILTAIEEFQSKMKETMQSVWEKNRDRFFIRQRTEEYLGCGAREMYEYVRLTLRVPFHRGLVDHPNIATAGPEESRFLRRKGMIGSSIGVIYQAIRDGRVAKVAIHAAVQATGLVVPGWRLDDGEAVPVGPRNGPNEIWRSENRAGRGGTESDGLPPDSPGVPPPVGEHFDGEVVTDDFRRWTFRDGVVVDSGLLFGGVPGGAVRVGNAAMVTPSDEVAQQGNVQDGRL